MSPQNPGRADFYEYEAVEKPAIEIFGALNWQAANCYYEFERPGRSALGRETPHEVVLTSRLRAVLERLNKGLPAEDLNEAIDELTRDRSAMSAINANREVYKILKDGWKPKIRKPDGGEEVATVKLIDWENPANNDFFLASQFWIGGDLGQKRPDAIGFVNGIPLVVIEFKAPGKPVEDAFNDNIRDYKSTIPQLFWYNAFIVVSNGVDSRVGSMTATWDYFAEWKKIDDEGEEGVVSLEAVIRGACERTRLLDIVENFIAFEESKGGLIKIVAKNHQYHGVNRAIKAVHDLGNNRGRLGVFWHTQGSGKSYSMVFFSQKIHRKVEGNWTFVVVTDRAELDDQIYKTFCACEAVQEGHVQATSADHLQRLLTEDHRYVFTLIQKFRTEGRRPHPKLSDRSDVIVITDEAHRSQYDIFAANMRSALPNAAFIGFTGTPLMAGEEKTREVFGDYVSIYTYGQSVKDGATVPLYYENRVPELQLTNPEFNEDIERLLEDAELDEAQEKRLEREFAREYHLITREDRLEKVAKDIVSHFVGRGYRGKAMVVSIDKATAVRMYDKVKKYWAQELGELRRRLKGAKAEEREGLEDEIWFMEGTDMAVVVSQGQNEVEDLKKKGVDITPHRKRMVAEDLDVKFKDPGDPFRIVFVCAMWMTGFDVPSCSTIYLDKPMRNHTLMQAIARANRVFKNKVNGLIVAYINVFRDLHRALAIYAVPRPGAPGAVDTPVQIKGELVERLGRAVEDLKGFLIAHGVEVSKIEEAKDKLERLRLLKDARESIIVNDEDKCRFFSLTGDVGKLYRAVLPDPAAVPFASTVVIAEVLADMIRALTPAADISAIMQGVSDLLDKSVAAEAYIIRDDDPIDLSKLDVAKLRKRFDGQQKRTELERLRAALERKVHAMVQLNRARMDFMEKLQQMIDEYNAGSKNVAQLFDELVKFAQDLDAEEKRGVAEGLTEEELALFDLLTKPDPKLTKKEEAEVKKVVYALLDTLKREKLVLDWRKKQQARQAVRLWIEESLDKLPPTYTKPIYEQKCDLTYRHVYDSYFGEGKSIYPKAG